MKPPKELDAIVDVVLRYRPKPKSKASKRRARRGKPMQRKANGSHVYNSQKIADWVATKEREMAAKSQAEEVAT